MIVRSGPVVSNTTPIISLVGIGQLDLLRSLYNTIWIPAAVREEYRVGVRPSDPDLDALDWITVGPPMAPDPVLAARLGAGEAAAIALASAINSRHLLLDERPGRQVAREYGLPVIGTLGVLVAAKQAGMLSSVRPMVDAMIHQGRHISAPLRAQVLQAAGESDISG